MFMILLIIVTDLQPEVYHPDLQESYQKDTNAFPEPEILYLSTSQYHFQHLPLKELKAYFISPSINIRANGQYSK
jgi:hypothetical protein